MGIPQSRRLECNREAGDDYFYSYFLFDTQYA